MKIAVQYLPENLTAVYLVAEIVGTRTSSGIRITLHLPVVRTAQPQLMPMETQLARYRVVIVLATVLLLIHNSPYVIVTQDQY